eukprot:6492512-Amphidinium_carterae.3
MDLATTQEELQQGMAEMRARGGDPGMIVGDLNGSPEDFEELAVLAERGWQRLHSPTICTCYAANSPGTAIDVVLCSPALQRLVSQPHVLETETIVKPHRPLVWELQVGTKLRAEQIVRRKPLDPTNVHPHVCDDVAERVLRAGTLEQAWQEWSDAAVAFYGGSEDIAADRRQEASTKHGALPVYTAREQGTQGGSHDMVRMQRLAGVLRSLQSAHETGHAQQVTRMLNCLSKRKLLYLLGIRADPLELAEQDAFWGELETLCVRAETKFKAAERAVRAKRNEHYQAWRERTHPCRAMATCAKQVVALDIHGWEHQGRTITQPQEIMSTLKDSWEEEWCVSRHMDPAAFMARFPTAAPVLRAPQPAEQGAPQAEQPALRAPPAAAPPALQPLDLEALQAGLKALAANKKPGPDGWSRDLLVNLNLPLQSALLVVLSRCEDEGTFPRALSTSQVVFLEKPGKKASPLTVRPICLMSEVYKLWTKMRMRSVYEVLTRNCSRHIVGGKPGVRIQRLIATTMMQLDTLSSTGEVVFGLHSDMTRCYERVPLRILERVLIHKGVHPRIVRLCMYMYRQPRILTMGTLSTWSDGDRHAGMPAGDPLAVPFMGILTTTLMEPTEGMGATLRAYIDDIVMHSFTQNGRGYEQFLDVHAVFREWVDALGFLTNDKTSVWSTTAAGQKKLEELAEVHGYGQSTDIRDLGVDIAVRGVTKSDTSRVRLRTSVERCYRLHRCSGFNMVERQLGALQLVLAKATWGRELVPASGAILSELGKSISKFVFGPVGGRNQELSLGVFTKSANLIPRYHQASRTVLFWQGWLKDTGGGTVLMQDAWMGAEAAARRRGNARSVIRFLWDALELLGSLWHWTDGGWKAQIWRHHRLRLQSSSTWFAMPFVDEFAMRST